MKASEHKMLSFSVRKEIVKNDNSDNFQPSQTCKKEINLYPKFYQELISLWEKVCIKEPVDIAEILSQPIWNNHFLQKQDSTLFY